MDLRKLRVNQVEQPMGFDVQPLSLSWVVPKSDVDVVIERAKEIEWTEVTLFEHMTEKEKDWGEKEYHIRPRGNKVMIHKALKEQVDSMDYRPQMEWELKPRRRYYWEVRLCTDNGVVTGAESFFETGKMAEPWEGQWISPENEKSAAILCKRFSVESAREARLYICGLGVYECYLNGKKVGDEYLAPGYHSYDFHLQAQTYDVSSYLIEGENEMEIWLGEGWFKGRLGFDGGFTDIYGDRLYAICELYANEELVLKTDETWSCKPSPITFNNIYDGEVYDARREGMTQGSEACVCVAPKDCGPLGDRYSLPIVKKESFAVAEVIRTPKGETVLDFGQEITGWVEIACNFPEGTKIVLTGSEIMQNGCFYNENYRTAKTQFTYIANGKPAVARPHFTFYGFRYMKVECDVEVSPEMFTAYHLRSDFDQIGEITTENPKLNRLFLNALWGQKDNFLDVPTDCPQRDERLGWTGDAQVFSETACYNMYMPAFYRKYLWDMRAEQSILGGSVPNVVPRLKRGMVAEHGSCPWADAGVIIPWNVYLHYGSKTLLAETYPGMKAWVDCQRGREEAIEGPHLVKDGFHFADWLALDNPNPGPFGATDPLFISSAYYYRCAEIVAKSAQILGYEEAGEYAALAADIKAAIKEKYFDADGSCSCKTQTGAAIAIAFGLADEAIEGEALEERVKANNDHLNTGFVGTTMLCPALSKTGHNDTAVTLLLNEDFPSWLYSVNLGATTIWERWDSVGPDGTISAEGMNSLNHYSYGSIEAWMYGYVAGIRPLEPGYKKAILEPHPDARLGFLQAKLDTSAGLFESGWTYKEDGSVCYKFTVPLGAKAELRLPDGRTETLRPGVYER